MNVLSHVRAFARQIASNGRLLNVEHRPEPGVMPASCFRAVAEKIEREGGASQMGWMFEGGKGFFDVVHHCVWRDPSNDQLVDITPFDDQWRDTVVVNGGKVVFLADNSATLIKPPGCEFGLARPNRVHIYNNKADLRIVSKLLQEERKWEQAIRTNPSKALTRALPPHIVARLER